MRTRLRGFLVPASAAAALAVGAAGCNTIESSRTVEAKSVEARGTPVTGPKYRVVIGKVENRSPYMRGVFTDANDDRLGMQAQQILKTHLSQSGRFVLMDRVNMDELQREAGYSGVQQKVTGGQMVVTGAVTEFGRKETGAQGAIFGRTKDQVAYAKVQVSVVDVQTSQVLVSEQGAGEYALKSGDVLGFGSSAGYDATLNDKVLNLAMIDVVNKLTRTLDAGQWSQPQ